jgi:hypothetical protein
MDIGITNLKRAEELYYKLLRKENVKSLASRIKPKCFNRPTVKKFSIVQDGWFYVGLYNKLGDFIGNTRYPRIVEIPFRMSEDCKQWNPFGVALKENWDCNGCVWDPRIKEKDNG